MKIKTKYNIGDHIIYLYHSKKKHGLIVAIKIDLEQRILYRVYYNATHAWVYESQIEGVEYQ